MCLDVNLMAVGHLDTFLSPYPFVNKNGFQMPQTSNLCCIRCFCLCWGFMGFMVIGLLYCTIADADGRLSGPDAVKFFSRSQLSRGDLKQVLWLLFLGTKERERERFWRFLVCGSEQAALLLSCTLQLELCLSRTLSNWIDCNRMSISGLWKPYYCNARISDWFLHAGMQYSSILWAQQLV